ncbi:MAG: hypothetical protein ACOVOG_00895, partial [Rubrivivax sp.]
MKFPYFPGHAELVDPATARRFTEVQVRKLKAMPVGSEGGRTRVAVVDPMDWQAIDELPRLLGGEVDLEIIPDSALMALIDRVYNDNLVLQGLTGNDNLRGGPL